MIFQIELFVFVFFFIDIRRAFVRSNWNIDFCHYLKNDKKSIGYVTGLSKFVRFVILNKSIYETSINSVEKPSNHFSESYIPRKWILLWYSKQDLGSQVSQDEVGFHSLSKMR